MNGEELCKRYEDLKSKRGVWENHWQEIGDRILPRQAEFSTTRSPGEKRTAKMFDATAALALERFAAAMDSILTPRGQRWHHLRASVDELNDIAEVRDWFETVENMLFSARYSPRANFASQQHETYMGLGAFGTGSMFLDEDPGRGFRYHATHLSEVVFALNFQGLIDTVYRKFTWTARQAFQKWGEELPDDIQKAAQEKPEREFDFLHCVMPREERDPYRVTSDNMPYASYYVSLTGKKVLSESGYRTFPYMISRYTTAPREVYGRSPAMIVLPDIKMINEMSKVTIRGAHGRSDPAILLADDGVAGSFNKTPGALNYGMVSPEGRPLAHPFNNQADVGIGLDMMDQRRQVINDAFLVTLFQILVETPSMTATEALIRAQEKGALLGPTMGRQQSESQGPQIERELDIMASSGALPPLPDALVEANGEYEIEYDSPMTRAQRAEEGVGIARTAELVAPFASVDPSILDNYDGDEIARISAEINGVSRILRDREQIEAMRANRAEQQQMAQLVASAEPVSQAVKNVADAGAA